MRVRFSRCMKLVDINCENWILAHVPRRRIHHFLGVTMYFRFYVAIALLTAIGLASIHLQKQNIDLNQQISHEEYELERLRDAQFRLKWEVEQLQSPTRLHDLQNAP